MRKQGLERQCAQGHFMDSLNCVAGMFNQFMGTSMAKVRSRLSAPPPCCFHVHLSHAGMLMTHSAYDLLLLHFLTWQRNLPWFANACLFFIVTSHHPSLHLNFSQDPKPSCNLISYGSLSKAGVPREKLANSCWGVLSPNQPWEGLLHLIAAAAPEPGGHCTLTSHPSTHSAQAPGRVTQRWSTHTVRRPRGSQPWVSGVGGLHSHPVVHHVQSEPAQLPSPLPGGGRRLVFALMKMTVPMHLAFWSFKVASTPLSSSQQPVTC